MPWFPVSIALALSTLPFAVHAAAPEAPIELAIWARIDGSDYLELRKSDAGRLEAEWKHGAWSPPQDHPVYLMARDRRSERTPTISPQLAWTIRRGDDYDSAPPSGWLTQLEAWVKPGNPLAHPRLETAGTVVPRDMLAKLLPDSIDLSSVRVLKAGGADAAVVMAHSTSFARIGFADMENGASNYRVVLGFDTEPRSRPLAPLVIEVEARVYASEHLILQPEGLAWSSLIGNLNTEGDPFRSASEISIKVDGESIFARKELDDDRTSIRFDSAKDAELIQKLKRARFDRARIARSEFTERRGPVFGLGAPVADDGKPALNLHISDPSYESYDSKYVESESAFKIRVEIPLDESFP